MSQDDRYGVVVYIVAAKANTPPFKPWAWEIYRDGEPLRHESGKPGSKPSTLRDWPRASPSGIFSSGLAREQASSDL